MKRDVRRIESILAKRLTPEQAASVLPAAKALIYRRNPLRWAVDKLHIDPLKIDWASIPGYENHVWDGTPNPLIQMAEGIVNRQWVAVEGATSTGKTVWLAMLALWFFDTFPNSIVITTAPTEKQLGLNIWRWIPIFHKTLGKGHLDTLRIRMNPPAEDWMILGYGTGVRAEEVGLSATRAQSIHAENLLFILEETPGIPDAILTAYENTCTAPNNIIVAVGNPDNVNDTLHKFSKRNPPRGLRHIRISAFDHPNVVLNNPHFVEGAQTRDGLAQLLDKYNNDPSNPMYKSRARGISPEQATDSLIRWAWCEEAAKRPRNQAISGPPALGVDVANSADGDEAAIARGVGSILEDVVSFHCPNANELGANVFEIARMFQIRPEYVGVDGVGVGAGTVNELKRLGFPCRNIQSGSKPEPWQKDRGVAMEERFNNLRSQMWWQLRIDLQNGSESGIILPFDHELFADLTAPRFRVHKNGLIEIEAKEDIRRRLGRSPNKGDAVVYWNWVRQRRWKDRIRIAVYDNQQQRLQRVGLTTEMR